MSSALRPRAVARRLRLLRRRVVPGLPGLPGLLAALAMMGPLVSPPAAAQGEALARLSWLAGCWASEQGEPGSVEVWMAPAGGTMFGMSRTVKEGRTLAFEFMQIHAGGGQGLVFVAEPAGQRKTSFRLLRHDAEEVVFENLAHDFPQRVIYRLADGGRLAARIEGLRNGALRAVDFPMRREDCEAQAARLAPR